MNKFLALLLGIFLACLQTSVHAQAPGPERGRFKLFLDANLLGMRRSYSEAFFLGGETFRQTATHVLVGPFSGGGIGAGFALTPYLVPQLYLSLQADATPGSSGGANDTSSLRYELSPVVEFVRPRGRVVPFACVGLALIGSRLRTAEERTIRGFGVGPALVAGVHAFVVQQAAIDVSLRFSNAFTVRVNGNKVEEPVKQRQFNLMLLVGSSFWL